MELQKISRIRSRSSRISLFNDGTMGSVAQHLQTTLCHRITFSSLAIFEGENEQWISPRKRLFTRTELDPAWYLDAYSPFSSRSGTVCNTFTKSTWHKYPIFRLQNQFRTVVRLGLLCHCTHNSSGPAKDSHGYSHG